MTTVRYDGTVHDFMLLNSLSETQRDARRDRPGHRVPPRRAPQQLSRPLIRLEAGQHVLRHHPTTQQIDDLATALKRTESNAAAPRSPAATSSRCAPKSRPGWSRDGTSIPAKEVGYIIAGTVQMRIEDRPALILDAGHGS